MLPSINKILISAFSAVVIALSIPIFSISFSVSLIPAVSKNLTFRPLISNSVSITSLVVPACSETIATSLPASSLINDDFPAFVDPISAMLIPLLILIPFLLFFMNKLMSFKI